jgi:hypothetical protein
MVVLLEWRRANPAAKDEADMRLFDCNDKLDNPK